MGNLGTPSKRERKRGEIISKNRCLKFPDNATALPSEFCLVLARIMWRITIFTRKTVHWLRSGTGLALLNHNADVNIYTKYLDEYLQRPYHNTKGCF